MMASPWMRNSHGEWCPNCEELISEEDSPFGCSCCGYPSPDFTWFDDDDYRDDDRDREP